MLLGEKIKELRDEHGVLQRQLAALLEIDTPMFSKIERGDRRAKRTQVIQLADYFKRHQSCRGENGLTLQLSGTIWYHYHIYSRFCILPRFSRQSLSYAVLW